MHWMNLILNVLYNDVDMYQNDKNQVMYIHGQ